MCVTTTGFCKKNSYAFKKLNSQTPAFETKVQQRANKNAVTWNQPTQPKKKKEKERKVVSKAAQDTPFSLGARTAAPSL